MKPTSRYRSALDRKQRRRWKQLGDSIIARTRRILDGIDAGRKDTH